jgi:hypothetical protein
MVRCAKKWCEFHTFDRVPCGTICCRVLALVGQGPYETAQARVWTLGLDFWGGSLKRHPIRHLGWLGILRDAQRSRTELSSMQQIPRPYGMRYARSLWLPAISSPAACKLANHIRRGPPNQSPQSIERNLETVPPLDLGPKIPGAKNCVAQVSRWANIRNSCGPVR